MTRTGKIARLPQPIRQELNQRLQDGEPGNQLVGWLNGLPRVQKILAEQFGGRPVSEQNLSEWKQGGYQDWLRHEESRALVAGLTEQADQLDEAADGQEISDRFAGVLAVELVTLTRKLLEEKTDPAERWQCLREALRELSQLRRDDHRAVQTVIKRNRWNRELEREEHEAIKRDYEDTKKRFTGPIWARTYLATYAELFGGGEAGKSIAATILEVQFDLPLGSLLGKAKAQADVPPVKPGQSKSDLIQPEAATPLGRHI